MLQLGDLSVTPASQDGGLEDLLVTPASHEGDLFVTPAGQDGGLEDLLVTPASHDGGHDVTLIQIHGVQNPVEDAELTKQSIPANTPKFVPSITTALYIYEAPLLTTACP